MASLSFSFTVLMLLLLLFACPSIFSARSVPNDQQSLLAFRSLISNKQYLADWSPAIALCNWTGVTCSRHQSRTDRVVALNLTGMDLRGPISPFLGNISFLRLLDLSDNELHSHIPPQLGRLSRLRELRLDNNGLEGNIPSNLSSCINLSHLNLSVNNLTGHIGLQLGSLAHLQSLVLRKNSLTGPIPSSLGNLSALIILDTSENSLTGAIPPQLGRLTALIELQISRNYLSGSIPQEFGLFTNLQKLSLHTNALSGSIPVSLSNISSLVAFASFNNTLTGHIPLDFGAKLNSLTLLNLWGNQLSGYIPISIGNCSKLTHLDLSFNKLSGSVPIELGKLSLLEKLKLHFNQLDSGNSINMPFLGALTNCSHLQELDLTSNKLIGSLPLTVGKLTNISFLSFFGNQIEGSIPPHINNLTNLTILDLRGNLFNGNIPSLQSLEKLEQLYLGNNKLEGNIPDGFKLLKHLGKLDICENMLSGKIPNFLHHLKQLRVLSLHHNYFSDSIPTSLGDCKTLEMLDLSHNRLSGSIPWEVTGLSNLQFYLNLSWNLLEGSLPLEISKIAMALAIDISNNHLIGPIPTTLGSCTALESLNLSGNSLDGSIPGSLGKLENLIILDLSSNSLSSTIPVSLEKLKTLRYLNLSFNNLTGEIPKGGMFANQNIIISMIGNPALCGPQVSFPCPTPKGHSRVLKKVLFPVIGVIAFILYSLLLGFLWRGNLHIQNFDFSRAIFQKLEHQRISYQELAIATNGFIEANLLGKGNFGSVYKGIFSDGTLVAVKVLDLQNEQVEKSFKVECNILKKVRHRNLVRIITSCSNLHFKGLVFEFMPNGSLEKHLYPNLDENSDENICELRLKTQLDIAIDVACAIEYLHHDSPTQIVHCDIKPSNVLLDEDMSGHLTDFGIARLTGATSPSSLTSTLALKGSIGYIAPEYGLGETISTQGDVYSYGILLLEMFTRKNPTNGMFVGELNLHKWVNLAFPNKVKEVIDNIILIEMDENENEENDVCKDMISLLHVALLCSKDSPKERPTMREVVFVLKSIRENLVGSTLPSRGLTQSISSILKDSSATCNVTSTSNRESSSTF